MECETAMHKLDCRTDLDRFEESNKVSVIFPSYLFKLKVCLKGLRKNSALDDMTRVNSRGVGHTLDLLFMGFSRLLV